MSYHELFVMTVIAFQTVVIINLVVEVRALRARLNESQKLLRRIP